MIHLTEEQRLATEQSDTPVRLTDPKTQRQYVLLRAESYEKLQRILAAEEVDPSLFEFEEPEGRP